MGYHRQAKRSRGSSSPLNNLEHLLRREPDPKNSDGKRRKDARNRYCVPRYGEIVRPSLKDLAENATRLSRSPLAIIALSLVLLYGIIALVAAGVQLPPKLSTALACLIIAFPILILCVFTYLVTRHHEKLYSPSDFARDETFVELCQKVARVETNTDLIMKVIESHPFLVFAKLPPWDIHMLRKLYCDGEIDLNDYLKAMPQEDRTKYLTHLDEFRNKYGWIELDGSRIRFSEKGNRELRPFVEIAIPRYMD